MEHRMSTANFAAEKEKDRYDHFQLCKYRSKNVKTHFHRNPEIYCVYSGKVRVNIEDSVYNLSAGDAVFISGLKMHSYECEDAEIAFALIGTRYLQPFYEIYLDRQPPVLLTDKEANKKLFAYIDANYKNADSFGLLERYACTCGMLGIIADAYGTVPAPPLRTHARSDLTEIINFIYDNASQESLSLSYLAKRFNYDPSAMSRMFGKYMRTDLRNFINSIRIQNFNELKNLPENKDKTVLTLAVQCGFNNPATFYRAYKKYSADASAGTK